MEGDVISNWRLTATSFAEQLKASYSEEEARPHRLFILDPILTNGCRGVSKFSPDVRISDDKVEEELASEPSIISDRGFENNTGLPVVLECISRIEVH